MPLPPAIIVPPVPPPVRNGLFVAATGPMSMLPHMQTTGAQWWAESCGGAHLYPPACAVPPYPAFTYDVGDGLFTVYPFVVYASEICGVAGSTDADAERRVRERLRLGEQAAAEKALWGGGEGVTGIFETLEGVGKVTHLADSANLVEAVSLLEQQAAVETYYGPLIIHARPRIAAYAASKGTLIRQWRNGDGLHLYSHYGSEFVFGAGYSGNKWDGTAPNATTETMYVTGRVLVWREDEVFVSPPNQIIDKATNQRGMLAVRAYAIGVECLTAATVVTRA
ncbi:MAG TPA: hypothetical protein VFT95_20910 [Micromonosporaceae bacterium]|nr:hypothetical protein [Micromonosporaceae bacterium]